MRKWMEDDTIRERMLEKQRQEAKEEQERKVRGHVFI